jgi:MarR family transcriptional regulator, transcriptional regulator for hemolysin
MTSVDGDEVLGLRRKASIRLGVIARLIRRHFDQEMSELGVTRSQWSVIAITARAPGITQREMAQALHISEASTGRLVDRLCTEGLLERRAKEEDRRAHCVFLTEAGAALTSRLATAATHSEEAAFAGLSREELDQLRLLLDRIWDNLGETHSRSS